MREENWTNLIGTLRMDERILDSVSILNNNQFEQVRQEEIDDGNHRN